MFKLQNNEGEISVFVANPRYFGDFTLLKELNHYKMSCKLNLNNFVCLKPTQIYPSLLRITYITPLKDRLS